MLRGESHDGAPLGLVVPLEPSQVVVCDPFTPIHLTVSPTVTFMFAGLNEKLEADTLNVVEYDVSGID